MNHSSLTTGKMVRVVSKRELFPIVFLYTRTSRGTKEAVVYPKKYWMMKGSYYLSLKERKSDNIGVVAMR